jgi:hypothetical protein
MVKSKRAMRRAILSRLYEHLADIYGIEVTRETFLGGSFGMHQIDALLAFKSDPLIDELRSALGRLEEGNYGTCMTCKKPLLQQLLDDDPARRLCSECEHVYLFTTLRPQDQAASTA